MPATRIWCRGIFAAGFGAALLLNASSAYSAGDGPYFSFAIGPANSRDVDGSDGITTSIGSAIAGNMALGYRAGGFRFEAEIGGQTYPFTGQTVDGVNIPDPFDPEPGSLTVGTFMGNLFYEFDVDWGGQSDDGAGGPRVRPYIGGGAGMAKITALYEYTVPGTAAENCALFPFLCALLPFAFHDDRVTLLDDNDWVFAYQAIAGLSFEIWDATDIILQYRFLATQDAEFTFPNGAPFRQEGILSHSFQLGVRYFF